MLSRKYWKYLVYAQGIGNENMLKYLPANPGILLSTRYHALMHSAHERTSMIRGSSTQRDKRFIRFFIFFSRFCFWFFLAGFFSY
jgi:hypothetical protein